MWIRTLLLIHFTRANQVTGKRLEPSGCCCRIPPFLESLCNTCFKGSCRVSRQWFIVAVLCFLVDGFCIQVCLCVFHSECCCNSVIEKRFAWQRTPNFQLSKVGSSPTVCLHHLRCTNALHLARSGCLLPAQERVRRSVPVLSPGKSSMCLPALSSIFFPCGSHWQKRQPSYRDRSTPMELVGTFALYVSHALGAPLRPGSAHTASRM